LQNRHPFFLGSTRAKFEQHFNRIGHQLPRSSDCLWWRILFPVGEKPTPPKFVEGYSLQILFTLSLRLLSGFPVLLLFDHVLCEYGIAFVVPPPLGERLKRE